MSGTRMRAVPSKHFAIGPYRAEQVGPNWWGVMNKSSVNVLTFLDRPGAVVTDEAHAKQIADDWNSRTEPFEYVSDSHVSPATTRMTDAEMSAYVRSRVYNFETGRFENESA